MPERTNELLEALEALTNPVRTKVIQDGPVGQLVAGQHVATVELPPLLHQLVEAIGGSIGIGGSASLANERNMLDADALYKFTLINTQVTDWARMAGATITRGDPTATLRSWYVAYAASRPELASERFYTSKMRQWATQIEDKLDPARVRELPDRCPDCRAASWFNPADKLEYLHPLVIHYKPHGPDMVQDAKTSCRACGSTWGVRQLAYEIEQAHLRDWDEALEEARTPDTRFVV